MSTSLMPGPKQQFFDNNGLPLIGGKVYTYDAGTSNPRDTFTDEAGTIAQPNPITLNARGEPENAIRWDGSYKVVLADSLGNVVYTIDDFETPIMADQLIQPAAAGLVGFDYSLSYPVNSLGRWLKDLLLQAGASFIGFKQSLIGAVLRTLQDKGRDDVSSKDLGIMSDGVTDDLSAWRAAVITCATAGRTLVVEDGVSLLSDWLPIQSGLKMRFKPNAQLKLTASTSLGGFVCCGLDASLTPVACSDVEIHGLNLDCNNIAGENGFNAVNGVNIRIYNPKIYNTLHSTVKLGGRAFQFEGASVDGVHVFSPYIQNCTIGINSQGAPSAVEVVKNINYFNVVMKNVDVPFNVDSQFASPDTNTPYTMSTQVYGATLFDCGKLTFPGAASPVGGGIVCGDRGAYLRINNVRIVNSAAYGLIGGMTRGVMFNVHLNNVEYYGPGMTAVFDFSQVGFGNSAAGTFLSTVSTSGRIAINGDLDYVVKAGPSAGRIGAASMRGVEINSTVATLTGLMDANSAAVTAAVLEVALSDQQLKSTGIRTLKSLYDRGNNTSLCVADGQDETGSWNPIDASGAGLGLTVVAGTATFISRSGWTTAKAQITYPANADPSAAKIGGLPKTAANLGTFAGSGSIGYRTEATLAGIYVIGNTTNIQLSTSAGLTLTNATMSGDQMSISVTYQSI